MAANLAIHPLADAVPPMTAEEYAELKADIRSHGLHEPITLYQGKILDGKHRYRACQELKLPFKTRDWRPADGTPAEFIISENVKRRHLTPGQRAAFAVAFAEELRERFPQTNGGTGGDVRAIAKHLGTKVADPKAQILDVVAPAVGAAPSSAEIFQTLQNQAPRLAKEVATGRMDLYAADQFRRQAARGSQPTVRRRSAEERALATLQAAAATAKQLRREIGDLEPFDLKLLEPNLMIALYHEVAGAAYALQRLVQRGRVEVPTSGREVKLILKGGGR